MALAGAARLGLCMNSYWTRNNYTVNSLAHRHRDDASTLAKLRREQKTSRRSVRFFGLLHLCTDCTDRAMLLDLCRIPLHVEEANYKIRKELEKEKQLLS